MIFRNLLLSFALAGAVFTAAGQTTTTNTRDYLFPPVGLASTETAELIAVNTAVNSTAGTAASCAGSFQFITSTGAAIGTATAFTLASGQSAVARLPFASAQVTGIRGVIRAVVRQTISTATPRPPCSLHLTFSTFDTVGGATHALVTGSGGGATGGGAGPGR